MDVEQEAVPPFEAQPDPLDRAEIAHEKFQRAVVAGAAGSGGRLQDAGGETRVQVDRDQGLGRQARADLSKDGLVPQSRPAGAGAAVEHAADQGLGVRPGERAVVEEAEVVGLLVAAGELPDREATLARAGLGDLGATGLASQVDQASQQRPVADAGQQEPPRRLGRRTGARWRESTTASPSRSSRMVVTGTPSAARCAPGHDRTCGRPRNCASPSRPAAPRTPAPAASRRSRGRGRGGRSPIALAQRRAGRGGGAPPRRRLGGVRRPATIARGRQRGSGPGRTIGSSGRSH